MFRKKPPLLSSEVVRRVIRVSRFNGMFVMVLSGAAALWSASGHDLPAACCCLLTAGAGALEFHGGSLLRTRDAGGLRWLVGSQLFLMATILGWCARNFLYPDMDLIGQAVAFFKANMMTPDVKAQLQSTGMTLEQLFLEVLGLFYVAVGIATVLFQGGMTVYYARKRHAVAEAFSAPEES